MSTCFSTRYLFCKPGDSRRARLTTVETRASASGSRLRRAALSVASGPGEPGAATALEEPRSVRAAAETMPSSRTPGTLAMLPRCPNMMRCRARGKWGISKLPAVAVSARAGGACRVDASRQGEVPDVRGPRSSGPRILSASWDASRGGSVSSGASQEASRRATLMSACMSCGVPMLIRK